MPPLVRHALCALGGVMLAASCGADAILGSPPPFPLYPGDMPPEPPPSASIRFSFEHSIDNWAQKGGPAQPVCGAVSATRLGDFQGRSVVTLNPPGNYWKTPVDVGQDGDCRIDTDQQRNVATELVSPAFKTDAPFIAFRLGGGAGPGGPMPLVPGAAVELRLAESHVVVRSERGPGTLAMERVIWDLKELKDQALQIVIRDDGLGTHGLLVDEVFDSRERPAPFAAPVWGFADMHSHPLTQLGFGRHLFVGKNDGPIDQALGSCEQEHGSHGLGGRAGPITSLFEASPVRWLGHDPGGYPVFDGWPLWSTQMHQQMYVDWIERAVKGGLRLMVAHVVNNEQLADSFHGEPGYDDVTVATAELEGIRAFVGRHPRFMEIAYTPRDARRIIGSGRLAVVMGVEVDSIGRCRRDDDCTEDQVRNEIRRLYGLGARHIFPVHLADNAFGGASVFKNQVFNLLTWFLRDTYQQVEHDASVDYYFRSLAQEPPVWLREVLPRSNLYGHGLFFPPYDQYLGVRRGHINRRGLTLLGASAVDEMIKLGIIVDIDHMGQNTRADTIRIAAAHEPPVPLAMGHTHVRDLGFGPKQTSDLEKYRHEAAKTADEIEAVRALGGAIAPITYQGDLRRAEASGVLSECAGSSASWLQAYAYLVDHVDGAGVGMGTDFNGFALEPMPRFGPTACLARKGSGHEDRLRRKPDLSMRETLRDDAAAQVGGVTYATKLVYASPVRFMGAEKDGAYSEEERDIWNGLACLDANVSPATLKLDAQARRNVQDVVAGFKDNAPPNGRALRRAAYLVRTGKPSPADEATKKAYAAVLSVWTSWQRMQDGNRAEPLERSVIPAPAVRDFDVNLDGLAHYGLIPDFLQDVSNQLHAGNGKVHDLSAMFRSAEGYVRMWELVEAAKAIEP